MDPTRLRASLPLQMTIGFAAVTGCLRRRFSHVWARLLQMNSFWLHRCVAFISVKWSVERVVVLRTSRHQQLRTEFALSITIPSLRDSGWELHVAFLFSPPYGCLLFRITNCTPFEFALSWHLGFVPSVVLLYRLSEMISAWHWSCRMCACLVPFGNLVVASFLILCLIGRA